MANFVYPIPFPVPLSNPYDYPEVPVEWETPITNTLMHISELVENNHIPIDTKLYHGSLDHHLDFNRLTRDEITFFGIDVVISLWYIFEMQLHSHFKLGKLYECVVIKPIPVKIITDLFDNPKENESCISEPIGCIHPQISFHGDGNSGPPCDLSIELSMNMKYFKDYIKVVKTYVVDPSILYENIDKSFSEFNPIQSIISESTLGKRISRKRKRHSKKAFNDKRMLL